MHLGTGYICRRPCRGALHQQKKPNRQNSFCLLAWQAEKSRLAVEAVEALRREVEKEAQEQRRRQEEADAQAQAREEQEEREAKERQISREEAETRKEQEEEASWEDPLKVAVGRG